MFLDRDGKNVVAVPVGRIAVRETPLRAVEPIAELDPWLESLRIGTKPPAGVTMHLRAVEQSVFSATTHRDPSGILPLLVNVSRLEAANMRHS